MLLYKCHQGVLQRVLGGSICYLNSVHEATAQEALRLVTSFKRSCAGVPGTSTLNELIVPEDKKLNAIWSSGELRDLLPGRRSWCSGMCMRVWDEIL